MRDASCGAAIAAAAARLCDVSETPRLDAELLMAHAIGLTREALLLSRLGDDTPPSYEALIARRLTHEPIAYITGERDFWTITLTVAPGVLIPRPDSETLIEAAVDHFGRGSPQRVLDLGTGSGALLLAALAQWPCATGLGIDMSSAALAIAQANAQRLGMNDRATFAVGNWAQGIADQYDLILCNPPYVETGAMLAPDICAYEPHGALYAGKDGLDDYRLLAPQISPLIAPGGAAIIEIGVMQRKAVTALFANPAMTVETRVDLAGRDRAILIREHYG